MTLRFVLTAFFVNALAGCTPPDLPGDVGTAAPAYAAASLSGDSVRLSDLRGHPVLLNAWATWCIPCRKEIPELQALHQKYSAGGLKVVGVSIDEAGAAADVAGYVKDFGMTYLIALDPDDRISTAFRLQGVPGSILIDSKGIVRWRHLGPFAATDPDFVAALQETL